MKISRRNFFILASTISASFLFGNQVEAVEGKYATLVDLTKCDGCKGEAMPLCVKACRDYNVNRFPTPQKPILPYWPRKTYEDWSDKTDKIDTLTPYNWIFVQKVSVQGKEIFIPRRCMHCDNPPCVRECPFGALTKQPEGNSVINDKICFGGAKCRDVCPWHIPQRQAGVGIYLQLLPKYAGGGVMYKCDLCKDRIRKGEEPPCVTACRSRSGKEGVFTFGIRDEIYTLAYKKVREEGLFIYGDKQNGGTSTLYLSSVSFELISKALQDKKERFQMPVHVENKIISKFNPIGKIVLASGALSMIGATLAAFLSRRERKEPCEDEED